MPLVYFESFQLVLVAEINYSEFIGKTPKINEIHRNKLQIIDLSLLFCARKSWKINAFHGFIDFSIDFYSFFFKFFFRWTQNVFSPRLKRVKKFQNILGASTLRGSWSLGNPSESIRMHRKAVGKRWNSSEISETGSRNVRILQGAGPSVQHPKYIGP